MVINTSSDCLLTKHAKYFWVEVGQEPTLFNETIAKNIAYGAPEATQAEIEKAAKQANAHNFIMDFADGYNTSGKTHF